MAETVTRDRRVGAGRFAYLDTLKLLLVVGVSAVHTAHLRRPRSFYLEDYDSAADLTVGVLTVLVGVGFLFGLGAFFLIAGLPFAWG